MGTRIPPQPNSSGDHVETFKTMFQFQGVGRGAPTGGDERDHTAPPPPRRFILFLLFAIIYLSEKQTDRTVDSEREARARNSRSMSIILSVPRSSPHSPPIPLLTTSRPHHAPINNAVNKQFCINSHREREL